MPAEPAADAVSAADVEAAKSLADTAEIDEHTCAKTFHDLDRQRAGLVGRAGADDLPTLRAAASEADLAVAAALAAQEALPGLASAHADVTLRQRELAGLITTATASEAAAAQKLDGLRTDLQAHEQAVAAGRDGHPSVADRQRALQASAGHHQAAADALASLRRALQSRDALLGSTEAEARARGFADLEVARAARRSPAESAAIEAAVTAWATTATTLAGAVGDARFADLDPLDAVPARQRLDDADTARTAADDARESALTSDAAAHQRLDGFTRRRADLTAAEQARTQVHDDTAAVVRLAGLAKGTTSALRMSLTTYVLRHWFEQVVQAANLRLRTMSNGRFVLERVDEAEKGERRTGLSLKVIDRHTGESRSPKSLSGGETFYTSLALALGLADVVRAEAGGVELDTLFIDEGFGTLDSETLDQVMSVIDELRNGGRAVGIVSHVADLKEQIAERLEIRRRDDGSSYTTVVA
jgi:exonuclease SbcC